MKLPPPLDRLANNATNGHMGSRDLVELMYKTYMMPLYVAVRLIESDLRASGQVVQADQIKNVLEFYEQRGDE